MVQLNSTTQDFEPVTVVKEEFDCDEFKEPFEYWVKIDAEQLNPRLDDDEQIPGPHINSDRTSTIGRYLKVRLYKNIYKILSDPVFQRSPSHQRPRRFLLR